MFYQFKKYQERQKQRFESDLVTLRDALRDSHTVRDASIPFEGNDMLIGIADPHSGYKSVITEVAGVHGCEGPLMSYAPKKSMRSYAKQLPDDTKAIYVLNVNPQSHSRMFDGVDMNRNGQSAYDHSNELLERLSAELCPMIMGKGAVGHHLVEDFKFYARVAWGISYAMAVHSARFGDIQTAITKGNAIPGTLYHRGTGTVKPLEQLTDMFYVETKGADLSIVLDYHSGEGQRGEFNISTHLQSTNAQFQFLRRFIPELKSDNPDDPYADEVPAVGSIAEHFASMADAEDSIGLTVDLGTESPIIVLKRMALWEQILQFGGNPDTIEKAFQNIMAAFSPKNALKPLLENHHNLLTKINKAYGLFNDLR